MDHTKRKETQRLAGSLPCKFVKSASEDAVLGDRPQSTETPPSPPVPLYSSWDTLDLMTFLILVGSMALAASASASSCRFLHFHSSSHLKFHASNCLGQLASLLSKRRLDLGVAPSTYQCRALLLFPANIGWKCWHDPGCMPVLGTPARIPCWLHACAGEKSDSRVFLLTSVDERGTSLYPAH